MRIWRVLLEPHLSIAGRPLGAAAKFFAVKATGLLDASPEQVHRAYFADNSRVQVRRFLLPALPAVRLCKVLVVVAEGASLHTCFSRSR